MFREGSDCHETTSHRDKIMVLYQSIAAKAFADTVAFSLAG
jgi:hypothetical protein